MTTTIVYGPQGCGKSLHSEKIRAHLGCSRVVDDERVDFGDRPLIKGALHLTHLSRDDIALYLDRHHYERVRVLAFADLPREVRS